jgi:hypothetical protein
MSSKPYLILISPGSALGSAMMTLGKSEGRAQRDALANEIATWDGHIITFSDELDDEIADYPMFARTIDAARQRALAAGLQVSTRTLPADDRADLCAAMAYQMGLSWDDEIVCTGAWASLTESGWVNAVCAAMRKAGFTRVRISENAIYEPHGRDADEELLDALCA